MLKITKHKKSFLMSVSALLAVLAIGVFSMTKVEEAFFISAIFALLLGVLSFVPVNAVKIEKSHT
jgi:hypothetical protein